MKQNQVRFLPDNMEISVDDRVSLMDAVRQAGIRIASNCGGQGVCGKCIVRVVKGNPEKKAQTKLTKSAIDAGYTLACVTTVTEDLIVEIPVTSRDADGAKVAEKYTPKNLKEHWASFNEAISPIVQKVYLELEPPTLENAVNYTSNLETALSRTTGKQNFDIPVKIVRQLGDIAGSSGFKMTVSIVDNHVVKVEPGDTTSNRYGLAIDIGTTSIATLLVDLLTGDMLASASCYNSQVKFGDDVISRIVHTEAGNGLSDLNEHVLADVNRLIGQVCKETDIPVKSLESIVFAGNTTMMHLLYKINPQPIREEPYVPVCNHFPMVYSEDMGMDEKIDAVIYSLPGVASYVGGDITSGVTSSRMAETDNVNLFIDIGTNGEIVLGSSDWLVTAACSAGPCFEGSSILHGMRATRGAIEEVCIDQDTLEVTLGVIDRVKPVGICGSGMIDALANMLLAGIIDQKGKFRPDTASDRVRCGEHGMEFVVCFKENSGTDRDIVLTSVDLENIIRAKGAIYAGLSIVLKEMGLGFSDVNSLLVAGGFGKYINLKQAKIIGLFPDIIDNDRISFLGNTSVAGAYLFLLSDNLRKAATETAFKMTNLELSVMRSFMDEYVSALFLPHTEMASFPNVEKMLSENAAK